MVVMGCAKHGPVFVGGVGGSGTRVFAQILQGLGVQLGPCLNDALDNLWFTSLLKRPEWVRRQRASAVSDIPKVLRLFAFFIYFFYLPLSFFLFLYLFVFLVS